MVMKILVQENVEKNFFASWRTNHQLFKKGSALSYYLHEVTRT